MLDQLINLVKEHAGDTIVNNPAIANEFNDSAINDVANQIFGGLKNQASSGDLQSIVSLFQGNNENSALTGNPMVSGIISSVTQSLASKFGVSEQAAQSISSSLLPAVMNQFINKTNDPNDNSFDLGQVLKSTSGNNGLDVGSLLGQFSGGGNNPLGSLGNIAGKLFGN